MNINDYSNRFVTLKNKFYFYRKNLNKIIFECEKNVVETVLTKDSILNVTPFLSERMGYKLSGKLIKEPIESDRCMKYQYDNSGKLIMVKQYSVFLKRFLTTEIYLHKGNNCIEKLFISSDVLNRLYLIEKKGDLIDAVISYSDTIDVIAEQYFYENALLKKIDSVRRDTEGIFTEELIYENGNLIAITKKWPSGTKRIVYTIKKPDFIKIKEKVAQEIKNQILVADNEFCAIGIEGFFDQEGPHFGLCLEQCDSPNELICEWNCEMSIIEIYNFLMDESQIKKCVTVVAEVLIELVKEGLLKDKTIYFHQNQVPVTEKYNNIRKLLEETIGVEFR